MEYVYHGSTASGLKKLEPRKSTHQQPWVYAARSKVVATIFMSTSGSDFFYSLGGRGTEESPIYLVERKPGMFDAIFNTSGSLYTLKGDTFQSGKTGWSAEVVSESDVPVLKEEHIENVLEKLEEYAKEGDLQLFRYPNRPDFIPLDNSDLIPKVIDWHNKGFKGAIETFLNLYPELEENLLAQLEETEKVR